MTSLLLSAYLATAIDPAARQLLDGFFARWQEVRAMTYRLEKRERMCDGELVVEELAVKLRKPASFYVRAIEPRRGQEVLYVSERDARHLVAHPGSFPDVTVTLDIYGRMATRKQHHPVIHTGLDYTASAHRRAIAAALSDPQGERLEHGGVASLFGRRVAWVRMLAGTRPPQRVEAKKGELLFAFAERVGQDAYVILCANPDIDGVSDRLAARTYTVPAYYAARTEFAIDLETRLPIRLAFYDTEGRLYEQYDYHDVETNPALTDADFDPKNTAYDF